MDTQRGTIHVWLDGELMLDQRNVQTRVSSAWLSGALQNVNLEDALDGRVSCQDFTLPNAQTVLDDWKIHEVWSWIPSIKTA